MRTWMITGANRGLGLEMTKAALNAGDQVVATARNADSIPATELDGARLLALSLDVTDPVAIQQVTEAALARFGRIDVLVNNAGYGQLGTFEEIGRDSIGRQFATNVFGVFDVTRAVLPTMRRQRSGHVISIASIAGVEGYSGSSIYCATKHAVSGWSEALGKEVAPFGIKVTCVYPGRFRTDFLDASSVRFGEIAIEDYAEASARHRHDLNAHNHLQGGDPAKFGTMIVGLVDAPTPPAWLAAGSDAYHVFTGKAAALNRNAEAWKGVTLSTDF